MRHKVIVVMGVCGVGKTSVAKRLAQQLDGLYVEADDFHPVGNVEAMRSGSPLTDDMRKPWLVGLARAMKRESLANPNQPIVAACSALKKSYRDILREDLADAFFVFLHAERDLIGRRMAARTDHFMPLSLLDSQLETLELPLPTEAHVAIDVSGPITETIEKLVKLLNRED